MRICLSLKPGEGLELSPHFGDSGRFVVYDTDLQEFQAHACDAELCRGPCRCFMPATPESGFHVVICRTIGHRVLRSLRAQGIAVFLTQAQDAPAALAELQSQQLAQALRSTCLTGRRNAAAKPAICKET